MDTIDWKIARKDRYIVDFRRRGPGPIRGISSCYRTLLPSTNNYPPPQKKNHSKCGNFNYPQNLSRSEGRVWLEIRLILSHPDRGIPRDSASCTVMSTRCKNLGIQNNLFLDNDTSSLTLHGFNISYHLHRSLPHPRRRMHWPDDCRPILGKVKATSGPRRYESCRRSIVLEECSAYSVNNWNSKQLLFGSQLWIILCISMFCTTG